ncbi:hypothetical protein BE08_28180 [Sorangium cellulosum]|uniref:Uncharacterized protein n=1 Tax=Sorangium cellulosum TaxID=56 RepID=A0A150P5B6_SORCE|nr:hypothetical protein BE08_28180 [Sorangium cellulosum]
MPTKTPVRVPASRSAATPACSSASQATSRSKRCCGSIFTASRGEIPKKCASNPSTSFRKAPQGGTSSPGGSSAKRPGGAPETASTPASSRRK